MHPEHEITGCAVMCRYTVKGVLGQGTFGQVVECTSDAAPDAPVAVKVIKNQAAFYHQVCCYLSSTLPSALESALPSFSGLQLKDSDPFNQQTACLVNSNLITPLFNVHPFRSCMIMLAISTRHLPELALLDHN